MATAVVQYDGSEHERQALAPAMAETASAAVAMREKASIEARFAKAVMFPRNPEAARLRLLAACRRPRFAETAEYQVPRAGTTITGPSIRLAEEAARAWGNLDIRAITVLDDDERRIVKVVGLDLETNLGVEDEVVINKVVERKNPRKNEKVLSMRTNSTGNTTYLVRCTEDDLVMSTNAAKSKCRRTVILQLVPEDLVAEAREEAEKTLTSGGEDPAARRRRMLDSFAAEGVTPEMVQAWLKRPLDTITKSELKTLAGVYTAMKEGTTTWADFAGDAAPVAAPEPSPKRGVSALKERLDRKAPTAPVPEPDAPAGFQDDRDLAED